MSTQANRNSSQMASSSSTIILTFVSFLLFVPVLSLPTSSDSDYRSPANQTFRPTHELQKLKRVRGYLRRINKPAVKTIQSPDGDTIDCVVSHLQPAFDHPQLKGQMPLQPPERPKGNDSMEAMEESLQQWRESGESCPEGTIPIRRTCGCSS